MTNQLQTCNINININIKSMYVLVSKDYQSYITDLYLKILGTIFLQIPLPETLSKCNVINILIIYNW